jgi:hypothetical protein
LRDLPHPHNARWKPLERSVREFSTRPHFRIPLSGRCLAGRPRAGHRIRAYERFLFTTPWVQPDPLANLDALSLDSIAARHDAIPPGVVARHGTGPLSPAQVPDLIGVKDHHYLDRTGLEQHRGIIDLMRYAALNQGGYALSNFDGFIPMDLPNFKQLPDPAKLFIAGRYSHEQLYALALYLYSLQPPRNPNQLDAVAKHGQTVFTRAGCPGCHSPPLYTNNKVPSLKRVCYGNMFGHSGWCAALEDWFDPGRLSDNYVPTGFKPADVQTYPV